jgi:hypothetical protein
LAEGKSHGFLLSTGEEIGGRSALKGQEAIQVVAWAICSGKIRARGDVFSSLILSGVL